MNRNIIDYVTLTKNVVAMINLLEYDAMRSPGKAKVNSSTLNDLYALADRYNKLLEAKVKPPVVAEKPVKKAEV